MTLLERIKWIKANMKQPKLLLNGDEFQEVAELVECKSRRLGTQLRYLAIEPDGRCASVDSGTIFTTKISDFSNPKIYKERNTAQKAIDKNNLLKNCSVKKVKITYELLEDEE